MNVKIIWSNFLNTIKIEVNPMAYDTWFKPLELYEYKDGICKIIVPYSIYKNHLMINYNDVIIKNLNNILGDNINVEYYTKEEIEELEKDLVNENSDLTIELDNNKEIIKNNNKIDDNYIHFSNLNKKYTFDNFIVGDTNKFAQRAALEVAESPGNLYNPFFIYGNSGLGKTHLMHAIGNYISEHSRSEEHMSELQSR